MQYNFDEVIERRNTLCMKWDNMKMQYDHPEELLPMWIADMDFRCPQPVVDAIVRRASHPIYGYSYTPDSFGKSFADWQKRRNGWLFDSKHVVFCEGVIPAISAVVRLFSEPEDAVMLMSPVYYPFTNAITSNGRRPVRNSLIEVDGRWQIDFDAMEKQMRDERVKLLLLCNPHNPVCRVYTREELMKIGALCLKYQVTIFSDEIHSDLVYRPNRHIPIASLSPELADITVTALAPSKTFNLAGLQASGLVIANEEKRRLVYEEMMRNFYVISVFAAAAMEVVFENDDYVDQLTAYLWENYLFTDAFFRKNCPKIRVQKPEATYLMWLDCREMQFPDDEALEHFFLEEAGIAMDFGSWFGDEGRGFTRLNIAAPRETLRQALTQIKEAYDRLGYGADREEKT